MALRNLCGPGLGLKAFTLFQMPLPSLPSALGFINKSGINHPADINQADVTASGEIMGTSYTLCIDYKSTLETISMKVQAQYPQHFAGLPDHANPAFFESVRHDSAPPSVKIVDGRSDVGYMFVRSGQGEGDAESDNALDGISCMFTANEATDFICENESHRAKIIDFRITSKPTWPVYGPITEEGSLDGILIGVGEVGGTAHLELQDGNIKRTGIEIDRETARGIAKHMFEPVRVFGTGRWLRDENGKWVMKNFTVDSFTVLDDSRLTTVIEEMRQAFKDSELAGMDDPLGALMALRDRDDDLD